MLNALIVDDEAPARSELRYLLEETGRIGRIEEASNAREAVEALVRSKEGGNDPRIDVIFLDISMPKSSGMRLAEALHKLSHTPAVVFVTAYSEYALQAFNVDAVDYLMKPVETERLERALDKVEARTKPMPQAHASSDRIAVEKGGHKRLIDVDDIRYIEAKDDYSCIYTADDRYLSTVSLTKLEQRLSSHRFYRVHRGYIVNLDLVVDVKTLPSGTVQLGLKDIDGKKIPVSRRRTVAVKRQLGL